jgi:hypothetical protein
VVRTQMGPIERATLSLRTSFYWAHLKTEKETKLINVMFLNKRQNDKTMSRIVIVILMYHRHKPIDDNLRYEQIYRLELSFKEKRGWGIMSRIVIIILIYHRHKHIDLTLNLVNCPNIHYSSSLNLITLQNIFSSNQLRLNRELIL